MDEKVYVMRETHKWRSIFRKLAKPSETGDFLVKWCWPCFVLSDYRSEVLWIIWVSSSNGNEPVHMKIQVVWSRQMNNWIGAGVSQWNQSYSWESTQIIPEAASLSSIRALDRSTVAKYQRFTRFWSCNNSFYF